VTRPVVSLEVPGTPVSRERVRVTRRGTFTPKKTRDWYDVIQTMWIYGGRPRLPEVPLALEVYAYFKRGATHYLKSGRLSAEGRRAIPGGLRDADSVTVSPVMDALTGCAWTSDRFFVDIRGVKEWAGRHEPERLSILAWAIDHEEVMRP
jgi:Holliday junction resolvase RusA-like endonuclease